MNYRKTVLCLVFGIIVVATGNVLAQSDEELAVFSLVNRERSKARLSTLGWDDRLGKLARSYSRKMAREDFFDHYDPEGKTVIERADDARIKGWSKIGENLFWCDDTPQFESLSVRGWMQSATHRGNILDRTWTATGIGIARDRDGQIFITQVFTHQ